MTSEQTSPVDYLDRVQRLLAAVEHRTPDRAAQVKAWTDYGRRSRLYQLTHRRPREAR